MFIENDSILAPDHARHPRPPTAPVPLAGELPVTAPAHQALRHELAKLRQEKAQFAEQLRLVREFGDTANNDEDLAIREEEAVVDARLARLEDIMDRASIVGAAESAGTVAIGSSGALFDRGRRGPFKSRI